MKKYKTTQLPDYFTRLLKVRTQTTASGLSDILRYINQQRSFWGLIQKNFTDIDKEGRVENIIRSLGFETFRNRMASIFINYEFCGNYDEEIDESLIDEILKIEKMIIPYSVEGNHRGFMLGFFAKMSKTQNNDENYYTVDLSSSLINLLKYSQRKLTKPDWILIILDQFCLSIGIEKLEKILKNGIRYMDIYNLLSVEEQKLFTENLLAYGQSINEPEFFVNDLV